MKKETISTVFNNNTNSNNSFLSTNDFKHQNKNIFNALKSNAGANYRRNSQIIDNNINTVNPNNNNNNNINYNNNTNFNNNQENNFNNNFVSKPSNNLTSMNSKNTLNLTRFPSSQIINLKNIGGDISYINPTNTPNQNNMNNNNLNNTQLNENKINNYNLESEVNLNLVSKGKSSTHLPNYYRNNFLNNNKISENNIYNPNYTAFNLAETPIRENIVDNNNDNNNNNISGIKEGKSVYLNIVRLYEDKEIDRSKSPRLLNQNNVSHLSMNKGVIRNIESNVRLKLIIKDYF